MEKCCRACDENCSVSSLFSQFCKVNLIMSELFCYKAKEKMLVDNKMYLFVEVFLRLKDIVVADVFPFQKAGADSTPTLLHSCFHLRFIVSNHD